MRGKLALTLLALGLPAAALAHGGKEAGPFLAVDFRILLLATIILAILIFVGVTQQKILKVKHEKVIFVAIAITVLAITGYLGAVTAYWDVISESDGPVHWHAHLEIEICGENVELPKATGLQGDVGTETLHHHNDMQIHVEGILIEKQEYDLQHFFEAIGGDLTADSISIPQGVPPNSKPKTYRNGDLCSDGTQGTLKVFVNGNMIQNPDKHVIAPYSRVPPGDMIKIVFGPEVANGS